MRVDLSLKNMVRSEFLENIVENDLKKVERRLKMFRDDSPIHISIHIEKNPRKEQYFCWINVYLPRKVIRVQNNSSDLPQAINKTFGALTKNLDKLKHKVERHLRKSKKPQLS